MYFESPGFDTWLAAQADVIDVGKAPWSKLLKDSRTRLFGKKTELECTDFADDDDDEPAKPAPKKKPKKASATKDVVVKDGLSEEKLGKGLAEAIELGEPARIEAYFAAAKERFPQASVWGSIALRQAMQRDDAALVRRLFEAGVSPDAMGPYGTLFENACGHASIEVVKAFLDAGASIDRRAGERKDFALAAAAEEKRPDVVKLLLERGADPNLVDDNHMGAIHHASHVFHEDPKSQFPLTVEIVRSLLDHGAEIDRQDGNARTALHWAVEDGNLPLVELLVARKAHLDLEQWNGDTPLTAAVRHEKREIAALLRAAGARTDVRNHDGWCVDDVAPVGMAGPKDLEVRLDCGPGRHEAKLAVEVSFKHAMSGAELAFTNLAQLASLGCAGSDVFAPWASHVTFTGGGLPNHGKGKASWTIAYEGVAPACFALWLRHLIGGPAYTITKLSLIGDGEPTVTTDHVRAWLGDDAREPFRAWPEPGFSVIDAGKGAKRVAWVSTKEALGAEAVQTFVSWLHVLSFSLPRHSYGPETMFTLMHGPISPRGFEIELRYFEKGGVFPHDPSLMRALTINALAKLHRDTGAIAGLEWALGVAGDAGTSAPTAAEAGPVEGDAIEVSPSGRASCRTCKKTIDKGALRFVEMDLIGKRYHHVECAAKKLSARFVAAMGAYGGEVPDRDALIALASGPKKAAVAPGTYPYAEVAKTGRASCLGCQKPIAKDALRVAVERQVETPQGTMARPGYYHLACAKGAPSVSAESVIAHTPGLSDAQIGELRDALE